MGCGAKAPASVDEFYFEASYYFWGRKKSIYFMFFRLQNRFLWTILSFF